MFYIWFRLSNNGKTWRLENFPASRETRLVKNKYESDICMGNDEVFFHSHKTSKMLKWVDLSKKTTSNIFHEEYCIPEVLQN